MQNAKSHEISKFLIMDAFKRVKATMEVRVLTAYRLSSLRKISKTICTKSGTA